MQRDYVRKMAVSRSKRRKVVGFLAFSALLCLSGTGNAVEWHATADIGRTAESFLAKKLGDPAGDTSVRAGMLDGRLKLAACNRPLEAFLRSGTEIGPKTIVGVRCPGDRPWKLYVPVEIVVRRQVWVARETLPRGHLITRDDLKPDIRDVSRMTSGYFADPGALVGQRLRAPVLGGRVLTPNLLEADRVVRRGQAVTLLVETGELTIRMAGRALADGARDERIRVENLNSGRVVEGIVRSAELVEVVVPKARNFSPQAPKVSTGMVDTGYSNNDR